MRFYLTTPIFYVNDAPHLGHAYTATVVDVICRYHRLFGHETKMLTGVDEHGQKVQAAAEKRGLSPQAHCDDMVVQWKNIFQELDIKCDVFFRTTDDFHKKAVQKCLSQLWEKGEIYAQDYEGWYAVSDEIFYTEKDLVNGKAPTGAEVTLIKEKNYFFKMSKYQAALIEHIEKNPEFIQPVAKKNEVLGFLRKPLHDLCISRPKTRLAWGIEMPFDKEYVTYVWFDALLNYATAVGYQQDGRETEFANWWQAADGGARHVIGKDILTTHTVYWPTMLMALGIALPKTIFGHGWWLSAGGEKMSKSKGNVVKPLDMKDLVGVDAFRYFLTRDIIFGNDAAFTPELVVNRVNSELANNFGNLYSRVSNLIEKNFAAKVPEVAHSSPESQAVLQAAGAVADKVKQAILNLQPQDAIEEIINLLNVTNKYIGDQAPWKQVKTDLPAAADTLYTGLEVLRITGILLSPVMPTKTKQLLTQIGWTKEPSFADASQVGLLKAGTALGKVEMLFPRIEWKPD
jgi:methionyl-tRNA synthetase